MDNNVVLSKVVKKKDFNRHLEGQAEKIEAFKGCITVLKKVFKVNFEMSFCYPRSFQKTNEKIQLEYTSGRIEDTKMSFRN